ncbi:uncharacterized protein PHACADRAFT_259351 [Phanerochaete carnosa HHB-10118-sp]|uniref:Uncharacterized protein n=1 Tax=Phanerochaete carnosa (strain HHB-10118-sp) TaxID=650164 RepID=K5VNX8_PHACS|nr:uncharacterized protein PHACADRAFT_259351 [Phanerochaete carnosa HHB-10118-sp]EKM53178.1 hypothetical protein PHACADRAFT_259351 [Phanerochaete carnosa HHB-10118-sp]
MRFEEDGRISRENSEGSNDISEVSEGDEEDGEEWGGINSSNGAVQDSEGDKHTGTKPKKPPTGEELRDIKDATNLYRSSSFKLQVRAPVLRLNLRLPACLDRCAPPECSSKIRKIHPTRAFPPRIAYFPQLPFSSWT